MSRIRDYIDFEGKMSVGIRPSEFEKTNPHDARFFQLHMKACDARRSEAMLTDSEKLQPFLQLRALLFRGRFSDARKIAAKISKEIKFSDTQDQAEIIVEKARMAVFEGQWKKCIELCNQAFDLDPVPLSLMTLFQLRALGLSELGDISAALLDLDRADSLSEIFREAQSRFYLKVLKLRIIACSDPSEAKTWLRSLWKLGEKEKEFNGDHLLTLLRAEIAIKRAAGLCIAAAVAASFRIAEWMGDRLYAGLALLDCASCGDPEFQKIWRARLTSDLAAFNRIKNLKDEILGHSKGPLSLSAQSISGQACGRDHFCLSKEYLDRAIESEIIAVPRLNMVVKLYPWSISKMKSESLNAKVISSLENEPVSKEKFFFKVWGLKKYSPRLHDSLIWTTLYRLRKKTGLAYQIEDSKIELQKTWIL